MVLVLVRAGAVVVVLLVDDMASGLTLGEEGRCERARACAKPMSGVIKLGFELREGGKGGFFFFLFRTSCRSIAEVSTPTLGENRLEWQAGGGWRKRKLATNDCAPKKPMPTKTFTT